MIATVAALGLLGLASASPVAMRASGPNYPPKGNSKGFQLVVNVTDPYFDLYKSFQNAQVAGIHVGAGEAYAGATSEGQIFYQNGTLGGGSANGNPQDVHILTDIGTPLEYSGLGVSGATDKTPAPVTINAGSGTTGFGVSTFPTPYAYLLPDIFLACLRPLEYYQGQEFILIEEFTGSPIPFQCTTVRLIPQCAELEAIPANPDGNEITHAFALDTDCYDDVAAINWAEYGP